MRSLEQITEESKQTKGKSLCAIIGNTGAGKSTIVNHMLGKKMILNDKGEIVVEEPSQEVAPIGNSRVRSETLFTKVYGDETIAIADCGGFLDSRGIYEDLIVVSSMKLALQKASAVKIALCCNINLLEADRGVHFNRLLRNVFQNFFRDFKSNHGSIVLLFTHAQESSSEELRELMAEVLQDLRQHEDKELVPIYEFLLRKKDGLEFIHIYNPLSDKCRNDIKKIIQSMDGINNCNEAFDVPYSLDTKGKLLDDAIKLADEVNTYDNQFIRLKNEISELEGRAAEIESEISLAEMQYKDQITQKRNSDGEKSRLETESSSLQKEIAVVQSLREVKEKELSLLDNEESLRFSYNGESWIEPQRHTPITSQAEASLAVTGLHAVLAKREVEVNQLIAATEELKQESEELDASNKAMSQLLGTKRDNLIEGLKARRLARAESELLLEGNF